MRNPLHRVTLEPTTRHLRVTLDGQPVAETSAAVALHETGLPVRWYVPREDVVATLDGPTATRTHCPYKGDATYWTLRLDGHTVEDAAWSYEDPVADVPGLAGLVCFYDDKVEVTLEPA